ncbi:MAG: type II toxin-antitoxin system VapC family toxin [Methylophilaceae bacterium]
MQKIYIETSIISYLTARPSSNLIAAAWQKETLDWWETQRYRFELFISNIVMEEAGRGDSGAASRRLEALASIPILPLNEDVVKLSKALIQEGVLPVKALDDALHIALSAVHGMDYLLTWNCRHIDNAEKKPMIRRICQNYGFVCPEIATPIELMGVNEDD